VRAAEAALSYRKAPLGDATVEVVELVLELVLVVLETLVDELVLLVVATVEEVVPVGFFNDGTQNSRRSFN